MDEQKQFEAYSQQKLKAYKKLNNDFLTPKTIRNFEGSANNFPHSKDDCLQCINEYYEHQQFPSTSQVRTLIGTRTSISQFKEKCRWKMCAVLNLQGGYIFITDEQKQKIQGGQWLRNQLKSWQVVLNQIKESIFPKHFSYAIAQVKVLSRDSGKDTGKSMIRVTVTPHSSMYTFFVMKKIDNFRPSICCYFLDSNDNTKSKDINVIDHSGYFYSIMLQKYRQNKEQIKKLSLGYPIKYSKSIITNCVKRISSEDELKISLILSDPNQMKVTEEVKAIKIEQTFKKMADQEPKITYKHQSLILLGSEADDAIINLLKAKLDLNKMKLYIFMKVYISYRSQSQKSIWFVSHEHKLESMQPLINQVQQEHKESKFRVLAAITVTKYITVQRDPKNDDKLNQFHEAFRELFGKPVAKPLSQVANQHQSKYTYYYKFQTFQQSVFSFIFLENLSIRSNYFKQTAYLAKEEQLKKPAKPKPKPANVWY